MKGLWNCIQHETKDDHMKDILPRCNVCFIQILIESSNICNWNKMHLGKKSIASIFSIIIYSIICSSSTAAAQTVHNIVGGNLIKIVAVF